MNNLSETTQPSGVVTATEAQDVSELTKKDKPIKK